MRKGNESAFGDQGYLAKSSLQGCTRSCGSVLTGYYPLIQRTSTQQTSSCANCLRYLNSIRTQGLPQVSQRSCCPRRPQAHALLQRSMLARRYSSTMSTSAQVALSPPFSVCTWRDGARLVATDMVHASSEKSLKNVVRQHSELLVLP